MAMGYIKGGKRSVGRSMEDKIGAVWEAGGRGDLLEEMRGESRDGEWAGLE